MPLLFYFTGTGYPVAGVPLHYSPGKTYKYSYSTETLINEATSPKKTQAQKDVGFKLITHVELTPVWNQNERMLIKLTVRIYLIYYTEYYSTEVICYFKIVMCISCHKGKELL